MSSRLGTHDSGPSQQVLEDLEQYPGNRWKAKRSYSGRANTAHVLRVQYLSDTCGSSINVDAFQAFTRELIRFGGHVGSPPW